MQQVPQSLKTWFIVHFVVDIVLAIPLVFFPTMFLAALGFSTVDPLASRLVGAALAGIGATSLLTKNKRAESYETLLTLKLIWSATAIVGIIISILLNQAPAIAWSFLAAFTFFFFLWLYYKREFTKKEKKGL